MKKQKHEKRDKIFLKHLFTTILTTILIVVSIVSCKKVTIWSLDVTASIFIYPIVYLLIIMFYERYDRRKTNELILLSIVALILSSLLIGITGVITIDTKDSIDILFNNNILFTFALIMSYLIGQLIFLSTYDFLDYKKPTKFMISAALALAIDSFIFVTIAYIGQYDLIKLMELFTGQFVLSGIIIIGCALVFEYTLPLILVMKEKDIEEKTLKEMIDKENKKILDKVKKEAKPKTEVKRKTKTSSK